MAYPEHRRAAADLKIGCAVITLSDTRTESTDQSGAKIKELLIADGQAVLHYSILPDNPAQLEKLLTDLLTRPDLDAILTTGGTGISQRDQTIDVIEGLIDHPLPGFGELFRMLSWREIGSGALLSRATAGIARDKIVFAMPGSTKAVELAMTQLILPELRHLVQELRKG